MKKVTFTRKLLAMVLTLSMVLSLQVSAVLAATATAQGFDQKATLYNLATNAAYTNVSELQSSGTSYVPANEGLVYSLTRVDDVFDINEDVQIQVYFGAGMNQFTLDSWKNNGMRYMSVLNASTGEVVANWKDETPDAEGKNSSGKYQIQYGLAGAAANSEGIRYTIPKAAFKPSTSYFVILGSATCGNNNSRMLYAPVIYLITTSDAEGAGQVDNTITKVKFNDITVNVVKSAADTSSLTFNDAKEVSLVDPITESVPGQEICLAPYVSPGLSSSLTVVDTSGNTIYFNEPFWSGGNGKKFEDFRFTMPNDAVTINAVFGYKMTFSITDGVSAVNGAEIVVQDNNRTYVAEADGSYVLPAGEYLYTATADGYKTGTGSFSVFENGMKEITLTEAGATKHAVTFNVTPADAYVTVKDSNDQTIDPDQSNAYMYILEEGKYTYTIEAAGYITETGNFTVSVDAAIEINLIEASAAKYAIAFEVTPSDAKVVVKDSAGQVVNPEDDGAYMLKAGTYSYTVSADGYAEVSVAEFVVSKAERIVIKLGYGPQGSASGALEMLSPDAANITVKEIGNQTGSEYYYNVINQVFEQDDISFRFTYKPYTLIRNTFVNNYYTFFFQYVKVYEAVDYKANGSNATVIAEYSQSQTEDKGILFDINDKNYYTGYTTNPGSSNAGSDPRNEVTFRIKEGKLAGGAYVLVMDRNAAVNASSKLNADVIFEFTVTGVDAYKMNFNVNTTDANVVVKNAAGEEMTAEHDGGYRLTAGTYTYFVTADGYKPAVGTFTVADEAMTIDVNLEQGAAYLLTFDVTPGDAELSLRSSATQNSINPVAKNTYIVETGSYIYYISKNGYFSSSGTVYVGADNNVEIELEPNKFCNVKLEITSNRGVALENLNITVRRSAGYIEQFPIEGGSYNLESGIYSYNITADGHRDATGTFSVAREDMVVSVSMVHNGPYAVTFNITPTEATVELVNYNDRNTIIQPETEWTYSLMRGYYDWAVKAYGYKTVTNGNSFLIVDKDQTVSVTLQPQTAYVVNFEVTPATATVEVRYGDRVITPEGDGGYKLFVDTPYTYTVTAEGYDFESGSFKVTGDTTEKISLTLTAGDPADIEITISEEDGLQGLLDALTPDPLGILKIITVENGDFELGDVEISEGVTLVIDNGASVTFIDNVTVGGALEVNGGTLNVTEGELTVTGELNVTGGTLIIGENGALNLMSGGELIIGYGGVVIINENASTARMIPTTQMAANTLEVSQAVLGVIDGSYRSSGGGSGGSGSTEGSVTVQNGGILVNYWLVNGTITVEPGGILTWAWDDDSSQPVVGTLLVGGTGDGAFIELTSGTLELEVSGGKIESYTLNGEATINSVNGAYFVLDANFTVSTGCTLTAAALSGDETNLSGVTMSFNEGITLTVEGEFIVEQYARVVLGKGAQIINDGGSITDNNTTASFGIVDSEYKRIEADGGGSYTGDADAPDDVILAYYTDNDGSNTPLEKTGSVSFGTSFADAVTAAGLSTSGYAWDNYKYIPITIEWASPTYNPYLAGAYTVTATVKDSSNENTLTGTPLTGTITVLESAYAIAIGGEQTGGIQKMREITATNSEVNFNGNEYLVFNITDGVGINVDIAMFALPITDLNSSSFTATISYKTAGATVEVWLADAMPNFANEDGDLQATILGYEVSTSTTP